jgi:hypothetical protein
VIVAGLAVGMVIALAVRLVTSAPGNDGGGGASQPPETETPPSASPAESMTAEDYAALVELVPSDYQPCTEPTTATQREPGSIATTVCDPEGDIERAYFDLYAERTSMDEAFDLRYRQYDSPTGAPCQPDLGHDRWGFEDDGGVVQEDIGEMFCARDESGEAWLYWTNWQTLVMGSMVADSPERLYEFWRQPGRAG